MILNEIQHKPVNSRLGSVRDTLLPKGRQPSVFFPTFRLYEPYVRGEY